MKEKIYYQNFSSFILRSPLFSFDFLKPLISGTSTSEETLMEICRLPEVDEALFLASPDLHSQMIQWFEGSLTDEKKRKKLHYGLMKYLLRMASRPTPFGLFAGFSIGKWDKEGHVELPERSLYERHTRMDMNYLCALAQDLAKHPIIKENILFYPNSSIYTVGDQLRYVEYRYRQKARRTHHIVAVDESDYLDRVLEKASTGALLKDLSQLLVDDEITIEEARDFIEELVESQVLVNQLEPAITGPEFLDQIAAVIEPIGGIDDIKRLIRETKQELEEIDRSRIGSTVSNYHKIAEHIKPLGTGYELKFLFQTDMVKPTLHCTLEWNLVLDMLKGFEVMNKLTLKPGATTLTQFREAFYERYETREVPLLHALDTEAGIGYRQTGSSGDVSPLVDDLVVGGGSESGDIKWNRVQSFLFKKYKEAISAGKYEVELIDKELEPFESDWSDLPDTFSAMVQIVEEKGGDNPAKKIMFTGFGGSSSGNLLGRFCHADPQTDTFVKEITAKEKELKPDVLMAEIIHLPESRVGNVLLRPVLRQHEIPYLAKAAVPPEDQLKVQDLMISVRQNRIVLRSKRLNKEIVPRLTNAHNYSFNALPIYHFLADLQTQGLRGGLGFSWGALANEYEFLPRVVYRNLIFFPATWNIKAEEIKELVKIKDDEKLVKATREWRESRKIPAYVLQADSDNKLFINLENALCINTLFSIVQKRGGFQLVEFLFNPENAVVKSKEGVFTNEFIFSFHKVIERTNDTDRQDGDQNVNRNQNQKEAGNE
jgi:hypothetical protein